MSVQNDPAATDERKDNSRRGSCALKIVILIVLILLLFFWRFIDVSTAVWTGTIKPGFPSPTVISDSLVTSPRGTPTATEYNGKYLRWAGQVKAGQYAVWGGITIQPLTNETPVGGRTGPRPPCVIYGNIHEMAGTGISLLIFDEENFRAWRNGNEDAFARYREEHLSDFNYVLDISQGSYYIVLDNRGSSSDAFVGFTGAQAYTRPLLAGETRLEQRQYSEYRWDMKNEKLTIFEFILRLFKPPYSISQTRPSMSNQ